MIKYIESNRMLTFAQACAQLNVHKQTMHAWIRNGENHPPFRRLGPRRLVISQEALSKWMADLPRVGN